MQTRFSNVVVIEARNPANGKTFYAGSEFGAWGSLESAALWSSRSTAQAVISRFRTSNDRWEYQVRYLSQIAAPRHTLFEMLETLSGVAHLDNVMADIHYALGVDDREFAIDWFTGIPWPKLDSARRLELLRQYVAAELTNALLSPPIDKDRDQSV